ncbi:MAG: hypothetical protein K2H35_01360 [Muribaculaceae bacterium]|nr:hypothetical protein [Muribaculaceae bacterium]
MKYTPRQLLLILAIIISLGASAGHQVKATLPTAELNRLNRAISSADLYMHDKMKHIDSLEVILRALPVTDYQRRYATALKISNAYLPMRADSALSYSEVAINMARMNENKVQIFEGSIARINALSTGGIFTRALADFQALTPDDMTPDMKISYWMAGRKLYGYMRNYVEGDRRFFNDYTKYHQLYEDSIVANLPENDPMRRFYLAERLVESGKNTEAKQMFETLIAEFPEDSNLYGMIAFQLGTISRNQGDPTGYASYLAKAAISDIKGCVKDGLALPALAEWLYQQGQLNDAFRYINFALQDAMNGNVRMRTVTIAALLPGIDEAYRKKINSSRDELMIYFLLVTFLFLVSVALSVMLLRTIKRARNSNRKIAQTAKLQESYIGHFIELASSTAYRLESFQKLVIRKISSGQGDELLKLIKSGKTAEEHTINQIYKVMDSALLEMYPDFIENLNKLLKPEERFDMNETELSPEVRIYGFVRLGVTESTRIAQILNYSVSTVYTYRNRMRNRAISRDTFDDDVMQIGNSSEEEHY